MHYPVRKSCIIQKNMHKKTLCILGLLMDAWRLLVHVLLDNACTVS